MDGLVIEKFNLDAVSDVVQQLKDNYEDIPFEKSNVFVFDTQQKKIDENVRKSEVRTIKDGELFDKCAQVLKHFDNDLYSFFLVRNDAMHIKYKVGDFFQAHADYLSLTTNIVEEFSLIISLAETNSADIEGGETKVAINAGSVTMSKATTTPKAALLFRKDLVHEGVELKKGRKEILMLNVWGTRQRDERLLVVNFPCETVENAVRSTSSSKMPVKSLFERDVAKLDRCYIIPISLISSGFPDSFLAAYITFQQSNNNNNNAGNITHYECTVCSFEEFEVVYRAITRQHVNYQTTARDLELLEFFRIDTKAVLIAKINDEFCSGSSKSGGNTENKVVVIEKDFILFDSEERTHVIADMAKAMRIPFVRFRVVMCEGDVKEHTNYFGKVKARLNMLPVIVSVGDYDNLFGVKNAMRSFAFKNPFETCELLKDIEVPSDAKVIVLKGEENGEEEEEDEGDNMDNDNGSDQDDADEDEDDQVLVEEEEKSTLTDKKLRTDKPFVIRLDEEPFSIGLQLRFSPAVPFKLTEFIHNFIIPDDELDNLHQPLAKLKLIHLPSRYDCKTQLSRYCHLDNSNMICFNQEEALRTRDHIVESRFLVRLQQQLRDRKISLTFRQLTESPEAFFCNENVYANLTFIELTGLLYLGDDLTIADEDRAIKVFEDEVVETSVGSSDEDDEEPRQRGLICRSGLFRRWIPANYFINRFRRIWSS